MTDVHPDMAYTIARLRHDELISARRWSRPPTQRRWSLRRSAGAPVEPVPLPPPRHGSRVDGRVDEHLHGRVA